MSQSEQQQIQIFLSQDWIRFYYLQKELVERQPKSALNPFQKSMIEWFLCVVRAGGTFTGKTFEEVKEKMEPILFQWSFHILKKMQIDIKIKSPLTIYRCIYLSRVNSSIPHKLPSSWTFNKTFAETWCEKPPIDGKTPFILEVKVSPKDYFVFNFFNTKQYEVVLAPCILKTEKIYNTNNVKCSIKNYYRLSRSGNIYVPKSGTKSETKPPIVSKKKKNSFDF